MFDIGFAELLLVSVIGLLVLGPERLPGAVRAVSLWLGRLRRSFNAIRAEIEREINVDEIKQDLHNEGVMQDLKAAEAELRRSIHNPGTHGTEDAPPSAENRAAHHTTNAPTNNTNNTTTNTHPAEPATRPEP